MTIYNTGTLVLKGVKDCNKDAVRDAFDNLFDDTDLNENGDKECGLILDGKKKTLWFDEYSGSQLDGDLHELAADLAPFGVTMEGDISFWGDYDGFILVTKDRVESYDKEYEALYTHTIEEIREILKERGYDVVKIKKGKKK